MCIQSIHSFRYHGRLLYVRVISFLHSRSKLVVNDLHANNSSEIQDIIRY